MTISHCIFHFDYLSWFCHIGPDIGSVYFWICTILVCPLFKSFVLGVSLFCHKMLHCIIVLAIFLALCPCFCRVSCVTFLLSDVSGGVTGMGFSELQIVVSTIRSFKWIFVLFFHGSPKQQLHCYLCSLFLAGLSGWVHFYCHPIPLTLHHVSLPWVSRIFSCHLFYLCSLLSSVARCVYSRSLVFLWLSPHL